jgi:thioredoxin-like negative regulator of GroEL
MKIIHINDKNAQVFKNNAQNKHAFVKYYSPTCPACIAMEGEWDNMCKDIDGKYNTDMILAQMDPGGMKELEATEVHTAIDYVPAIVILKNGKKYKEYNGQRKKDEMIKFLMEEGLITPKMTMGGKKIKKIKKAKNSKKINKSKKSKKSNKSKKTKYNNGKSKRRRSYKKRN